VSLEGTDTRPGSRKDLILNLVQSHLDDITKAILAGARAALPVYRTTPVPVLHRESGLLPAVIELSYLAAIATVRLRRLDPYDPLRRRAEGITRTGLQTSRFARRVLALPESEQLDPPKEAPWLPQEAREAVYQRIKTPTQTARELH
jgi:hypothetical protein